MTKTPLENKPKGKVHELAATAAQVQVFAPTITVYGDPPADHPIYQLIGRVTAEWSAFEHHLDVAIWEMMGVDNRVGACVTSQLMGHAPRFLTIFALANHHRFDEALTKKIKRLMEKSYETAEKRNRITHDRWVAERVTGTTGQFKKMSRKELRFGIENADEDALRGAIKEILGLKESALALLHDIRAALTALRRKPTLPPPLKDQGEN